MYKASVIAYAFVKKAIEEGNPVSQMKLQKLVYFAQGIHLAMFKKPLIKDTIQAWKFGPVIPDIYHEYKLYGSDPIVDFAWVSEYKKIKDQEQFLTLDENALYVIDATWEALKSWNAIQLSNWTHTEGSPWQKAYRPGVTDIAIDQDDMATYFKQYIN